MVYAAQEFGGYKCSPGGDLSAKPADFRTKCRSTKDSTQFNTCYTTVDVDEAAKAAMVGSDNDAAMAAAAKAPPKRKKRRTKSRLGRHARGGDRKKSESPHAPDAPRNPSQPTQPPTSNGTKDPRIFNLKRGEKRRDKRIEQLSADNQQLQREVVGVEKEIQLVEREAAIKVIATEREADKVSERAAKKMRNAVEVTTRATAKMAAATIAANDAKTTKKQAVKEKAAATMEKKKMNKNKLAEANRTKKMIEELTAKWKEEESKRKEAEMTIKKLEKELREAKEATIKERLAKEELENALEDIEAKDEEESAPCHITIAKENREGTGLKRWPLKIVQLIMEYLVAGGAPSAFDKILTIFVKILHPNSTIEELPSKWFVRRCRTVLVIVCQLMSAYRLARAETWGQLNCDETKRHQSEYLNLVLSCAEDPSKPQEYTPILMSACILPEDGSAVAQKDAIVSYLAEMNTWLDEWATLAEKIFPELEHGIVRGGLKLSKLHDGGLVTQDTCNSASKGSDLLLAEIEISATADGITKVFTIKTYCHHHLRNIWWKWLEDGLSKFLRDRLEGSLAEISPNLRVSTKISDIIRAIDKEFSLPANYAKGQGKEFLHWLKKYHPGVLLVATLRSAGSRHDLNVEGAGAIYYNRHLYLQFLDEQLRVPNANNILQENLFIILSAEEMIALCRLCSIFHFAFSLPLRWLAANTHELAKYDWSVFSMSRALNAFEKAMLSVKGDGKFILNEDWVMNKVFQDIAEDLPPFKEYLKFIFETKKSSTVSKEKVLSDNSLRSELFRPTREENEKTSALVEEMAVVAAECVLKEMHDQKKHTWEHLDSQDGPLAWKNVTPEMHEAGKGKLGVNDASERPFGGMTQQMESFTTLCGMNATGVPQARINGDFNRVETARNKTKKADEDESQPTKNGSVIELDPQLLQSMIEFALKKTKQVRLEERKALTKQQEQRAAKLEKMKAAGYEKATQYLIDCLYYHDMYFSPRRLKDAAAVDELLGKLTSKTAKLDEMKEQIRIRVLGLGWEDLHHPWSKDGKQFSFEELASHLKNKIIPEESKREIPDKPPVKSLDRKELPILGTQSADVIKLNVISGEKEKELRETAEKIRDERELDGIGDRYEEMQGRFPPKVDEELLNRRIEICALRGEMNHWHSGTVIGLLARENWVEIHYDADV